MQLDAAHEGKPDHQERRGQVGFPGILGGEGTVLKEHLHEIPGDEHQSQCGRQGQEQAPGQGPVQLVAEPAPVIIAPQHREAGEDGGGQGQAGQGMGEEQQAVGQVDVGVGSRGDEIEGHGLVREGIGLYRRQPDQGGNHGPEHPPGRIAPAGQAQGRWRQGMAAAQGDEHQGELGQPPAEQEPGQPPGDGIELGDA